MSDTRLLQHRAQMAQCDELKPLLRRRTGRGVWMAELANLVNEVRDSTRDIVMLDWIQYRDYFCLAGYNARTQQLSIFDMITSLPITDDLPGALNTSEKLKSLWPIVAEIHKACKPGDILVFCPSKVLKLIPLHVLPYKTSDDHPIIHYHPIVYAPNNTVLKECVERALSAAAEQSSSLPPRASFFCRYPEDQQGADTTVGGMTRIFVHNKVHTTITSGSAVTQGGLKAQFTDADFLHLHGHTAGHDLERHLVLDTGDIPNSLFSADPAARYTSRTGLSPFLTLSEIQQANQELMLMLMGGGSGIQVIRKGDDAFGLVNSFLSAGATSVVATVWHLDNSDAARFSTQFYWTMFAVADEDVADSGSGSLCGFRDVGELIDLATTFQKSVNAPRACNRPRCLRKSLSARLLCHRVSPYHWAPFTLSGSWVC
ncbi:CHAT domain-containing protein [Aspergillus crustosus]